MNQNRSEIKKGVTVIVSTYNGASKLPPTLQHLANQQVKPTTPWEIIVVNNASNDNTVEVVEKTWAATGSNVKFTFLHQPKPGKMYAQNLAQAQAKYEYLLICDDDNHLNPNYIQTAFEIMESDERIGALGGIGEVASDGEIPNWFNDYHNFFGCGAQGPENGGDTTKWKGCLYGAGMVHRKSVWEKMEEAGFEGQLTCRKGEKLTSGGDTELTFMIKILGYKIWYSPKLSFKHFMPQGRLTIEYRERLFLGIGESNAKLIPYRVIMNKNYRGKKKKKFSFQLKKLRRDIFKTIFNKNFRGKKDFWLMLKYHRATYSTFKSMKNEYWDLVEDILKVKENFEKITSKNNEKTPT